MTFQLGAIAKTNNPIVKTTYQFAAKIRTNGTVDETYRNVIRLIIDWVRKTGKAPRGIPKHADTGEGFSIEVPGQSIECQSLPEKHLWSLRLVHPDAPFNDKPAVPGRTWQTDICLTESSSELNFGIKLVCSSLPYANEDVTFSRPRIVLDLAAKFSLYEQLPISAVPWTPSTPEDAQKLVEKLLDPQRRLPIVAVSEPFQINPSDLAKKLVGYAHVVTVPHPLTFSITDSIGKYWSVFHGGIRVYLPGLNLQTDSPFSHPLLTKDKILSIIDSNPDSPKPVEDYLVFRLAANAASRYCDFTGCAFVTDVKMMANEITRLAFSTEKESSKEWGRLLEQELELWKVKLQESEKKFEELIKKNFDLELELEHHKSLGHDLRTKIDSLQQLLNTKAKGTILPPEFPATYEDVPTWVRENLAGSLVLHSRAERGLSKAQYSDISLVCNSLMLLATEYRDMRRGVRTKDEFEAKLNDLGLKHERSITPIRAGEEGSTYFVRYPTESSPQQLLEWHLKKGADRDSRNCLRIYYFWDEDSAQVVVGWLPSHLETRKS